MSDAGGRAPGLRVAVPNKGALSEAAARMLGEAGYRMRGHGRDLVCLDAENDIEFYYLRPRDIATYVGSGTLDLGITGRDLLADSPSAADEVLELDFGASAFRFAAPPRTATRIEDLQGRRIATSYDRILGEYLAAHDISAEVVRLDGAVESSVQLGVADAVADVVETGATLRAAGLEVFGEPILSSQAVLIRRPGAPVEDGERRLVHRLRGVLVARTYVMVDYVIATELLPEASVIAPGFESPTVSPLQRDGWSAVRVMVPRAEVPRVMDELYDLGARAILSTDIHAARL